MTKEELQRLIGEATATSRATSSIQVGDEAVGEKENVDILHPVQGVRTIHIERRALCSFNHVLSDANQPVARCSRCSGLLCAIKGCLETCASVRCGRPVCPRDRWRIAGQYYCTRHVLDRVMRLVVGF